MNLTRLVEAAKGSGGAGWFGIEAARRLAAFGKVLVLTRPGNVDYVAKALGDEIREDSIGLAIIEGSLQDWLAGPGGDAIDVYLDPLNGLDPEVIPGHIAKIAVIHDLMFMREPYVFTEREIEFRCEHYGEAIRRADLVLTVAEREADDIRSLYPGKAVCVVNQPAYFMGTPSAQRGDGPPVLFSPGVQWNHKNHFRLVSAFLRLIEEGRIDPASRLCISGVLPVEANHQLLKVLVANSAHPDAVIQLPYLSRDRFAAFIARCDGIVLPSLHEGYGIPLVEAVVSGKPILTGHVPSVEALAELPESVRFIDDVRDEACIADALAEFVTHLPKASPRPDLCPSSDSFAQELCSAVAAAASARRSRSVSSLPAQWAIKRRKHALTIFVRGVGDTVDEAALSRLDGIEVRLFGHRDQVGLGHVRVGSGWQSEVPQAVAMAHDLLLCESRFVLICDAAQLGSLDISAVRQAMARLKIVVGKAKVRPADLGLPQDAHRHGPAAMPSGLYDLDTLDLPFEALPAEILAELEQAPLLTHPTSRRALIIDPSLKNANGHHLTVASALARSLKINDFHVAVACNYGMTLHAIPGADEVFKLLSDYLYEQNGDIGLAQWEFHTATDQAGIAGGDLVFAFCATPTMLAALALQLAQVAAARRPHVVIRFDRPEWRTPPTAVTYADAFRLLRSLGLRKYFSFTVESKGLQRCFELSSGETFPIRFNYVAAAEPGLADLSIATPAQTDGLVVSYVGEAREEKGFQHLPGVLARILPQVGDDVRFRIQCGANAWNQTPMIVDAKQALVELARNDPRIELLDGALPEGEYLELIRGADIVFLPYFPPQYRIRGSGVATEAAAFGTEMVVSHGLDITETYPDAIVTESRNYSVDALAEALLSRIKAVTELAPESRAARRRQGSGEIRDFAMSFLVNGDDLPDAPARIALWIANDTRGEGSDAVYRSQIAFLKAQGYFVVRLVAPYPAAWRLEHPADFDTNSFAAGGEVTLNFRKGPEIEHIMTRLANGGDVLKCFMEAWNLTTVPPLVERLLRHSPAQVAVVNYAHHDPIIRRLVSPGTPTIVETHDIQALQYAIQQNRVVDEQQLGVEMELVGRFDHIVSISKTEANVFAERCGADKVSWCMPFVSAPRAYVGDTWDHDLLFVGSAHHANLESLRWFLAKVYQPLLHPQGVSLAIVGNAGQHVDVSAFGSLVTCPGRVPDLADWYARSALAILPIVSGAGVPVKVIDAMTRGAAFVLTDFPAKAMDLDPRVPVAKTPLEFAEQVLGTLADRGERERRAQVGKEFIERVASEASYHATWQRVFDRLHLGRQG